VGYVVWRSEQDPDRLRDFLAEYLPGYMIPDRWVSLDVLPTLPSGKLDRAALSQSEQSSGSAPAPRTAMECFLAKAWAEILQLPEVGQTDSFFDLGGHSYEATLVVGRIRSALGYRVPVRVLFDHPGLADFALEVERIALRQLEASTSVSEDG
jgi:hypothetical protein